MIDDDDLVLDLMRERCDEVGMSWCTVPEGNLFMFNKEMLMEFLEHLNENQEEHILICLSNEDNEHVIQGSTKGKVGAN